MLKKKNQEYQRRLLTLKQVSTEAGAQGKKKPEEKALGYGEGDFMGKTNIVK